MVNKVAELAEDHWPYDRWERSQSDIHTKSPGANNFFRRPAGLMSTGYGGCGETRLGRTDPKLSCGAAN